MVRIINQEKKQEPEVKLTEKSKVLLQIIGIVIADKPKAIQELLEDYSIELADKPDDKELTDKLLSAIGECDKEFNNDLSSIILDCTLENNYDSFDFKSIFNKGGDGGTEESTGSSGGGGGGLWGGIANAVGGIGGAIGQGIKGKQAKDQAAATTLQGIYSYKAQLAATEQSKSKNKAFMLLGLFLLLGLAVAALAYYNKKQQQPIPLKA